MDFLSLPFLPFKSFWLFLIFKIINAIKPTTTKKNQPTAKKQNQTSPKSKFKSLHITAHNEGKKLEHDKPTYFALLLSDLNHRNFIMI